MPRSSRGLSDADVRAIREAHAGGETQRSIAARYGLAGGIISHLCVGRYRLAAGGPITIRSRSSAINLRALGDVIAALPEPIRLPPDGLTPHGIELLESLGVEIGEQEPEREPRSRPAPEPSE